MARGIQARNAAIVHSGVRLAEPALDVENMPYLNLSEGLSESRPAIIGELLSWNMVACVATVSQQVNPLRRIHRFPDPIPA